MHKDKTILLVDDDLEILKLLETISLRIGFKPVLASSGKEALKKFVKYLPGVAVVDYNLPDMTGDEVIVEIKKMRPIIQPIVITGYGEYEKAVKALQSGAVDYIKKPFKKENIENAVNSAYARFKQLKDTMEVYHVLAVTQNDDIREYLKSSFSKDNWDINFCDSYSDTYKYLSTNMTDIVLIDIDNAENEAFAFPRSGKDQEGSRRSESC
ncbi:MAG: response regulator [Elusimicrobiota bacterium]